MPHGETWNPQELEIISDLYGRRMNKDIAEVLTGRSVEAIKFKARQLGLKSNRKFTRKLHTLNSDYFAEPGLENSYWAGFIAADGNVDDAKDRVRIKLSESDVAHLEAFRACCGCSTPLRNAPNGPRNYKALEVNGTGRWREDLLHNYCITPRKTLMLQPPSHLPRDASLAFITGYIDGDGCIFTEQLQRGNLRLGVQITGTREMLLWIKSWFDTLAPIRRQSNVCSVGKIYSYKIVGRKTETILGLLVDMPTPKLPRKWTKVSQFLCERKREDNLV